MHPDLEHLIRLQSLELELQNLKRAIDTEDERRGAIQKALDNQKAAMTAIRDRLTANQEARRVLEKDVAQVQGRLTRYKEQLMEVKTNKEYHAMQTEITTAESEVRKFEDHILESLVEGDDILEQLKAAERELSAAESSAKTAIQSLSAETAAARTRLEGAAAARAEVAGKLPRPMLNMFETIANHHRGPAIAVATVEGHCSVCHVRMRPQMFQLVRRNDTIIQCDSCQRILYYVPPSQPAPQAIAT